MIRRLWVDIAVAAAMLLGIAIVVGGGDRGGIVVALSGLALLLIAYVCARPMLAAPTGPRAGWIVAVIAVSFGVMTWGSPSLATMQVIGYPLVWMISPRIRAGVVGSCAVGVGMFAGTVGGLGWSGDVLRDAGTIAVLSVAFAIVMGWWITSTAEYGDERARLVDELTSAQHEVAALHRDKGMSDERERIAREIHDTLAQTLAGLVILAEQAGRRSRQGDSSGAASTTARLESVAREALDEARALVARTAAVPSDDALEAAIERLVARFRDDTGLEILVRSPRDVGGLDRDRQVVILRCLQEALSNVRRHAHADRVVIDVSRDEDGVVRLVVQDDGRGFDRDAGTVGYGLEGMRDRVALADGVLEVRSAPGAGTTLSVALPAASMTIGRAR